MDIYILLASLIVKIYLKAFFKDPSRWFILFYKLKNGVLVDQYLI